MGGKAFKGEFFGLGFCMLAPTSSSSWFRLCLKWSTTLQIFYSFLGWNDFLWNCFHLTIIPNSFSQFTVSTVKKILRFMMLEILIYFEKKIKAHILLKAKRKPNKPIYFSHTFQVLIKCSCCGLTWQNIASSRAQIQNKLQKHNFSSKQKAKFYSNILFFTHT